MGMVITLIFGLLIVIYAFVIIRKSIRQVKAGKCITCSVKSDDCHCHSVHDIINLEEGDKFDEKN